MHLFIWNVDLFCFWLLCFQHVLSLRSEHLREHLFFFLFQEERVRKTTGECVVKRKKKPRNLVEFLIHILSFICNLHPSSIENCIYLHLKLDMHPRQFITVIQYGQFEVQLYASEQHRLSLDILLSSCLLFLPPLI